MNGELSDRLAQLVQGTDLRDHPELVSKGARLLSEVQKWEEEGELLRKAIDAFERSTADPSAEADSPKSLADWAYEVLLDEGSAMPYREITEAIKSRGYKHTRMPKDPNQLYDSVWGAIKKDQRFTKVERGVYDLTERL